MGKARGDADNVGDVTDAAGAERRACGTRRLLLLLVMIDRCDD